MRARPRPSIAVVGVFLFSPRAVRLALGKAERVGTTKDGVTGGAGPAGHTIRFAERKAMLIKTLTSRADPRIDGRGMGRGNRRRGVQTLRKSGREYLGGPGPTRPVEHPRRHLRGVHLPLPLKTSLFSPALCFRSLDDLSPKGA